MAVRQGGGGVSEELQGLSEHDAVECFGGQAVRAGQVGAQLDLEVARVDVDHSGVADPVVAEVAQVAIGLDLGTVTAEIVAVAEEGSSR